MQVLTYILKRQNKSYMIVLIKIKQIKRFNNHFNKEKSCNKKKILLKLTIKN